MKEKEDVGTTIGAIILILVFVGFVWALIVIADGQLKWIRPEMDALKECKETFNLSDFNNAKVTRVQNVFNCCWKETLLENNLWIVKEHCEALK